MQKNAFIILLFVGFGTLAGPGEWFLMARHGECVELNALERKIENMDAVTDPNSFVELMHERGHEVSVEDLNEYAVQISVPGKGLALVMVRREMCSEIIYR